MVDRPLIFSAPMVRALIEGRKAQTRRMLKLPTKGIYERPDMGGWAPCTNGGGGCFTFAKDGSRVPAPETVGIWHQTTGTCLDAPWQIGDRAWVREAFTRDGVADGAVAYRADGEAPAHLKVRWRSPIHMPRWASRITLDVIDVRVQRLQDIAEADGIAEGVKPQAGQREPHVAAFADLWRELHGSTSWAENPWVCAISFRVTLANIDSAPSALAAPAPPSTPTGEDR